jgi:L-ascorbate metabolism protein UlaG (beta-lactamase superfamily)
VIRLVRHATLQVELGGQRLLVDPMLDPAGARPPVANTPAERPNPLIELPCDAGELVAWADAVLVTHLHADHFDDTAANLIGDRLPVLCQPEDAETLAGRGIAQLRPVGAELELGGLRISRTGGRHGTGELADALGPVSGFVIAGEDVSVYVAGDTVWCAEVQQALDRHAPDVVVVNAGGARFLEGDPITMTARDVLAVRDASPGATLVAVHLEAINHCVETRADLAAATEGARVLIPADGEVVAA